MRDFTKYEVWNEGIALAVKAYELTSVFPDEEKFGLVSQIRRSSVSISSNFAEGCSRTSEKDFKRFIEIALGSSFEVKTQLIIAERLKYLKKELLDKFLADLEKNARQLNALRNKLK